MLPVTVLIPLLNVKFLQFLKIKYQKYFKIDPPIPIADMQLYYVLLTNVMLIMEQCQIDRGESENMLQLSENLRLTPGKTTQLFFSTPLTYSAIK